MSIHVSFLLPPKGRIPFSKPQSTNETVKEKRKVSFVFLLVMINVLGAHPTEKKTKGKAQKSEAQTSWAKNENIKKDFSYVKEQEEWKTFSTFSRLSANIPGKIFLSQVTKGWMGDDIHVKIAAEQQAVYWLNEFNLLQFFFSFPITFGKTFSPCAAVRCHFEGNQYFLLCHSWFVCVFECLFSDTAAVILSGRLKTEILFLN